MSLLLLFNDQTPLYEELLGSADQLLKDGHADAALVTAHTACELCAEQTISQLFRMRGVPELAKPVRKLASSCNLTNERVRALYAALSKDDLTAQPFWRQVHALSQARNDFIHAGSSVLVEDAACGLETARLLIAHLTDVLSRMRREVKQQELTESSAQPAP